MKHVDLEKFANGAFSAQVNRAIEEVTENIQNPNTDAGATRKITVTIAFKPNAERNFVATGVQTKTTLAPALGAVTAFSMGKNLQTGEVEADGGLWKNAVMKKIKEYLEFELSEELEKHKITVIA